MAEIQKKCIPYTVRDLQLTNKKDRGKKRHEKNGSCSRECVQHYAKYMLKNKTIKTFVYWNIKAQNVR